MHRKAARCVSGRGLVTLPLLVFCFGSPLSAACCDHETSPQLHLVACASLPRTLLETLLDSPTPDLVFLVRQLVKELKAEDEERQILKKTGFLAEGNLFLPTLSSDEHSELTGATVPQCALPSSSVRFLICHCFATASLHA